MQRSTATDTMTPQRILIVIGTLQIGGGAEKVAATVGSELTARGHEVHLLTFYEAEQKYPYTGIYHTEHEPIITNRLQKLWRIPQRIWRIQRYARAHDIQIAVSFLEEANIYTILAKLFGLWRLPVIVSVRNNILKREWPFRVATRLLYPFAHTVVSVTRAVEEVLRSDFKLTNTTTIYNPLDYARIEELAVEPLPAAHASWYTSAGPVCISIGRLIEQKGQWHLIRAFSAVRDIHPTATLLVLGEGEYCLQLEKLINDCQLTDAVHLLGKHENVYRFLARADLFVFSSLWEGMPNTMLEAHALGLPIVSPDCVSGPREIIAPEASITTTLSYPYQATHGVLTAPLTRAPIWERPAVTSLTPEEQQLATAIAQQLTRQNSSQTPPADRTSDPRFTLKTVVGEWEKVIVSVVK